MPADQTVKTYDPSNTLFAMSDEIVLEEISNADAVVPGDVKEEDDGRARSTVQVMTGGMFNHPWLGTLLFDREFFDKIVDNFDRDVLRQQVGVDLDHRFFGPAYGWIEELSVEGDGQESTLNASVRWTDEGAELIRSEAYKYTSGDITFNFKDNQGKFHGETLKGFALTNRPFLVGMEELTLNASAFTAYFSQSAPEGSQDVRLAAGSHPPTRIETTSVSNAAPETQAALSSASTTPRGVRAMAGLAKGVVDALRAKFGIGDEKTDDEVTADVLEEVRAALSQDEGGEAPTDESMVAALNEILMSSPKEAPADPTGAAEEEIVPETELTLSAEVDRLRAENEQKDAQLTAMGGDLEVLMKARNEQRAEVVLAAGRDSRKTTPAMEEAFLRDIALADPDKAKTIIDAMPVQVALEAPTGTDAVADAPSTATVQFKEAISAYQTENPDADYKTAYLSVVATNPALHKAYQTEEGRGVKARQNRINAAKRTLQDEGVLNG